MSKQPLSTFQKVEMVIHLSIIIPYTLNLFGALNTSPFVSRWINYLMLAVLIQIIFRLIIYRFSPAYGIKKAFDDYQNGSRDYDKGISDCLKALRHKKRYDQAYYVLTILYNDSGKYDKALESIKIYMQSKEFANHDDNIKGYSLYLKGFALYNLKKYDEAIALIEPLKEHVGLRLDANLLILSSKHLQKKYDEVIREATTLLESVTDSRISNLKVAALYQKEDFSTLLQYLEECLEKNQNYIENATTYADIVVEQSYADKYSEAVSYLTNVLAHNQSKTAFELRAKLYTLLGQDDKASDDFTTVESINHDMTISLEDAEENLKNYGCIEISKMVSFTDSSNKATIPNDPQKQWEQLQV